MAILFFGSFQKVCGFCNDPENKRYQFYNFLGVMVYVGEVEDVPVLFKSMIPSDRNIPVDLSQSSTKV